MVPEFNNLATEQNVNDIVPSLPKNEDAETDIP